MICNMSIKKNEVSKADEEKRAIDNKRKKRNSIFLFVTILVIALIASFFAAKTGKEKGTVVVVTVDGEEYYRGSLFVEQELAIGNTNTLRMKDGTVDMIEADCPDQICVKQTPISQNGESIICLPNRVVVSIEVLSKEHGASKSEWDAIVK